MSSANKLLLYFMNVDLHINKVYEDNDTETKDTKGEKLRVLSMSLHNKKAFQKADILSF